MDEPETKVIGSMNKEEEIADLLRIGGSTVTNVLSGGYKENDFLIKAGIEIDKKVNL